MYENRIEASSHFAADGSKLSSESTVQGSQFGEEIVDKVKKLAVEKPMVVVAAGLAIGVLAGFVLKRT